MMKPTHPILNLTLTVAVLLGFGQLGAQDPGVTRGLAAGLEAVTAQVQDAGGSAIAAGANMAVWTDGTAVFSLANNTNPADGPTWRADGDPEFDANLFNGNGYLEFDAPESGDSADPGDALYSETPHLNPAETGAVGGSVFVVLAPSVAIDRGDIFGTRSPDPDIGTSNGFFVEPRFDDTADIMRFWNGNPGGAGGYAGDVSLFSEAPMANDASVPYILEWQSLASNDEDGHRAFYINGELVGEDTESVVVPSGAALFGIGGSPDNLNSYDGAIAAVYIYEAELTEQERHMVGTYLQDKFGVSGTYGEGLFPVSRGLSVALSGAADEVQDSEGTAVSAGGNVAVWTDGTAVFSLANNTNPEDGPVFRADGDPDFDPALFNGRPYLFFNAPESGEAADPGDALYSEIDYLSPEETGPVGGSIFIVLAPSITIDRGDIVGTRAEDPDSGSSNGFFIEPRFDDTIDIMRFWNGNPGGAGGYAGDVSLFSGAPMANEASTPYILEWQSLASNDEDGHRAFYINGELVGEDTDSAIVPSDVALFGIGGSPNNLNAYEGAIAAVYIFEEELTEAERTEVGLYLQETYGISGAYTANPLPDDRGLAAHLAGAMNHVFDAEMNPVDPGGNVAVWSDGVATFSLAENPNPGDGPVYRDAGDPDFDASLFNGKGYLEFDAPESGDAADPGDSLYSSDPILMPARTGAVAGSIFMVIAPEFTVDRGDIVGTRGEDPDSGTSNGFFVEPRLIAETNAMERFWNGNPGGAGGYEGTVAAFSEGTMANDGSKAYILEWRSLTSTDADGHRAFYINGELVGQDTESVVVRSTIAKLGIGGSVDNPNSLNGALAAVMIYNEELTDAERATVGVYLQNEYGIDGAYAPAAEPSENPILIDFGKPALTSGGGTPAWNDVVNPVEGENSITGADMPDTTFPVTLIEDLVNAAGESTGISLVYSEWIPGDNPEQNGNGIAGMEVSGEMPDTGYPESATIDSLFVNAGATVVMTLEGLNPALAYDLKFFGTNSGTDNRVSVWVVNGLGRSLLTDLNTAEFATFESVVPSFDGTITIAYYALDNDRDQGQWATLEINEVTAPVFDQFDGVAKEGVRFSPWFGIYNADAAPYILKENDLWFYISSNDTTSLWLYSYDDTSWWWTARDTWPVVYGYEDGEWYYLWSLPMDPDVYLYRYSDGEYVPLKVIE